MINGIISFIVGVVFIGVLLYLFIDAELVRSIVLAKRAKKAYQRHYNNKLESEVNKIEEKLK